MTIKRFQAKYDPTIEDVYRKEITLDDKEYPRKKYPKIAGTYVLEIFDTAGQVWKYLLSFKIYHKRTNFMGFLV